MDADRIFAYLASIGIVFVAYNLFTFHPAGDFAVFLNWCATAMFAFAIWFSCMAFFTSEKWKDIKIDMELRRDNKQASKEPFPTPAQFIENFDATLKEELRQAGIAPLLPELHVRFLDAVRRMYASSALFATHPDVPGHFSSVNDVTQSVLSTRLQLLKDPRATLDKATAALKLFAKNYISTMPESVRVQPRGVILPPQPFTVAISSLITERSYDEYLSYPLTDATPLFDRIARVKQTDKGETIRTLTKESFEYLKPLYVDYPIPYGGLPDEARFQHQWVVAPSGTGKTTLLETLINTDLQRVARGEASVFIMDSQNELIPKLASMAIFHKGGALEGKLVVLEPDPDHPLALNIFDNQLGDLSRFSTEDRENLYTSSLEMADFIMSGLLGADLTAKQKGIFRYITQALQVIPDATIHTFADLLTEEGYERHREHILTLDAYAVDFFERRFNTQQFRATKEEIYWRLDAIMSNTTFRRMFSHPKNKLNLFEELQGAKVICVNTKLGLLKKEGTEIFGRYFLAMLLQATERRMLIDRNKRLPTFCYIDECHDYIADEPRMASLLDKARKQRVSFTLAHQRLANIRNSDVLDALANVRVKYAARNRTDAATLSKLMSLTPEQLAATPEYHFYFHAGDRPPILVTCPPDVLARGGTATAAQREAFRIQMRDRYSAPPATARRPEPVVPQARAAAPAAAPVAPRPEPPPRPIPAARRLGGEDVDTGTGQW